MDTKFDHSQTELVFSLLFDELCVPLVRLRPPPAQGCTLFCQTGGRGSGLRGMRNTLRFLLSKDFLSIGKNAWLSQQICLISTMKILGTKLIEVCCGLFETLQGSTQSVLESDNYNLTSDMITILSDDLFNCAAAQKYILT